MKKTAGHDGWLKRYTALYLLIVLPMIACLLFSGKTLLWRADAFYQHYTALNYTGETIRRLLSGGGFAMIDPSLGQGFDSIATMAYYGLFDPFQWPAALFSGNGIEIYYHLLMFAYVYAAGFFFCVYARRLRIGSDGKGWAVAASGLIFAFSGYNTIGVIKHPYFATGSIYLALMLIAVERVFENRKWLMLSLVAALMLAANFYFAFQTTLLVIVYILIRLFARIGRRGVRRSAGDGFMLMGSYLLGLAISMAVLLPVAITFLNSSRSDLAGGYTQSLLYYPPDYYAKLFALAFAPYDYAGYWSLQSFSPLCLFALMLLFARRKNAHSVNRDEAKIQLRTGFIVCLAFMCVPLAGKMFNGMGYVANRWSYGYAFVMSIIVLWALPKLMAEGFAQRKKLARIALAWAALMLVYGAAVKSVGALAGGLAISAAALFLILFDAKIRLENEKMKRVLLLLTGICCLAYSVGYPVVAMTSKEFYASGLHKKVSNESASETARIQDDSFFRVDTGVWNDCHASMHNYNGLGYYWSLVPGPVSDHYVDLQQSTLKWTFRLEGLGSDPYLEALASVGYSLRNEGEGRVSLPYGHELQESIMQADGDEIGIYRNAYALPLGYVFENVLSEQEYDQLGPVEKREALISAAVLETADLELAPLELDLPVQEIQWELAASDGVEFENNKIHARKDGTVTLRFQAPADSTTYLHMDGAELIKLIGDTGLVGEDTTTDLSIDSISDAGTGRIYLIRRDGVFNYDQQGVCLCLGYGEAGLTECTLHFDADAVIGFDALRILSAPMDYYRDQLNRLRENAWDGKLSDNRISGSIEMDAPGVLQISMPYSSGWSAYVDGKDAEVLRCGGMYMGLALEAGVHQVELEYATPGLKAGACISASAILLAALLCAAGSMRKKARR